MKIHGIHHVTAICGEAQENLNFYVGVLGLRLVKRSVNQDDPTTYHLFYADGVGTPGTDLTFFPWPELPPARAGTGCVAEVAFAVQPESLDYWQRRLARYGVAPEPATSPFGETVLRFQDPHGLRVALVATTQERPFVPWADSPVPPAHQLRGFYAVQLWERTLAPTEQVLTEWLGFRRIAQEGAWYRYAVEAGALGQLVDVQVLPEAMSGRDGRGGVHHVAWRTRDVAAADQLRRVLAEGGLRPTGLIDRFWFTSVYFREPGGVLFELATDGPGFTRDEDPARLGEKLVLPPGLESRRAVLEAALPPLQLPERAAWK
ncbi:MAG: ring-cleaving dioxygenase [Rhodothermus sp.]|nr:ring-cleaving dioxygenase [Rhodothermus sp.]